MEVFKKFQNRHGTEMFNGKKCEKTGLHRNAVFCKTRMKKRLQPFF